MREGGRGAVLPRQVIPTVSGVRCKVLPSQLVLFSAPTIASCVHSGSRERRRVSVYAMPLPSASTTSWVPQKTRDITLGRLDGFLSPDQFSDVNLRSTLYLRRSSEALSLEVWSVPQGAAHRSCQQRFFEKHLAYATTAKGARDGAMEGAGNYVCLSYLLFYVSAARGGWPSGSFLSQAYASGPGHTFATSCVRRLPPRSLAACPQRPALFSSGVP